MPDAALGRDIVAAADGVETQALKDVERLINAAPLRSAQFVGPDNERVSIPTSLYEALRHIIPLLVRGDTVSLVPVHQEVTTQQAADLLNVSRPHLITLLDRKQIPFTKVGTHRRIRFVDLMRYKLQRDAERRQAINEMTALAEEFGAYD